MNVITTLLYIPVVFLIFSDISKFNINMLSLKLSEIIYGMRLLTSAEHQTKVGKKVDSGKPFLEYTYKVMEIQLQIL